MKKRSWRNHARNKPALFSASRQPAQAQPSQPGQSSQPLSEEGRESAEMIMDIPGYYYDSAKRKYFRIEDSRTAPADAAWSSRNVRRRTAEAEESKRAAERRRRRRKGGNGEVHQQQLRRARVWEAPLLGGLLMREAGVTSSPPFHSSSSSDYSCFSTTGSGSGSGRGSGSWETTTATTTSLVRAWTAGLRDKGAVRVWSAAREGSDVMVSALWVGAGDDERSGAPGLGVAYAAVGETYLAASYVPRDGEDNINFGYAAERYPGLRLRPAVYSNFLPRVRGLAFHEPSRRMLVASMSGRDDDICIRHFTPSSAASADGAGPTWVLDDDDAITTTTVSVLPNSGSGNVIHAIRAASSPGLLCVAGTSRGLAQLRATDGSDARLTWLAPPCPVPPHRLHKYYYHYYHHHNSHHRHRGRDQQHRFRARSSNSGGNTFDLLPPWQREILSVDFLGQNPAETLVAGARSGEVLVADLRAPPAQWGAFRHASSAAHARAVGPYGVLAAGPRSAMALYDVRFLQRPWQSSSSGSGSGSGPGSGNATRPVVEFCGYRNEAHIQTGLDVLGSAGYGGGLVAAAHDDGTVGVYTVRDGRRVAAGAVDGVRVGGVVRSVVWQTLPGDRHPSLFVGEEGASVKKYSFWA